MTCNLINQDIQRYKVGNEFSSVAPTPPAGNPPSAIAVLLANVFATSAALAWTPNGNAVSLYRRDVTANGTFLLVTNSISGAAAGFLDTGLSPSTQYQWRITANNQYGSSPNSNTVSATSTADTTPVGNWAIATPYRIGQKLPMRLLHPRPDVETSQYACHRKANTNWAYRARICVQGGEPPFKFEIISGPVGSVITEEFARATDPATGLIVHSLPTDYATVRWSSPSGNASWDVKITDQSGQIINATWTTQTDNTAFLVVDTALGNDVNPGTFASPVKTFVSGVWKSSATDATYANKIIAFKAGVYPIYQTIPNQNISINEGVKSKSYIAIESGVIFDTTQGHIFVNTGDITFSGIHLRGSRNDQQDNRIIQISNKNSNYLFEKLTFSQQTFGTQGFDNPACIVFMDDSNYGHNISIVDCTLLPTAKMQLICTFASDGVLIENNDLRDLDFPVSNGDALIQMKDDTKNATIRFNVGTGQALDGIIRMSNQQNAGMLALNQEVIYNYIKTTSVDWESAPIIWNQNATGQPNAANTHCARNTVVSPTYAHCTREWLGGDKTKMSGEAWVAPGGFMVGTGFENVLPVSVALTAGDLDANGKLTNATGKRNQHLGKIGFEIAST